MITIAIQNAARMLLRCILYLHLLAVFSYCCSQKKHSNGEKKQTKYFTNT